MALYDAHTFLKKVDVSADLQEQIDAADWDSHLIASLAATQGLRFTDEELQTAIDETWGVLSEEELVNAAGGAGEQNPNPNPAPGLTVSGGTGVTTWSPPPGDVSGNSCLFGWKCK